MTSNLQIRFPSEDVYEQIRACGGAAWARPILEAGLRCADPAAVLAAVGDATAEELREALDLARGLRPLRAAVDDPARYALAIAERTAASAQEALGYLLASGWAHGEILAVLQADLGTIHLYGMTLGGSLACECYDAERLGGVDLEGWGVSPERWAWAIARLRDDSEAARAVLDVARVFWAASEGSALERALRRGVTATRGAVEE